MPGNNGIHFDQIDYQSLSPRVRDALVRRILRQAQIDRADAIRTALSKALAWLGRAAIEMGAQVARLHRTYATWRRRRLDIVELNALSDHELKDIGVRRSEIYWVVHHGRDIPDVPAPETISRTVQADPGRVMTVRAHGPRRPVKDNRRAAA